MQSFSKSQLLAPTPFKKKDSSGHLKKLRGTMLFYKDPNKPAIPESDWDVLKR